MRARDGGQVLQVWGRGDLQVATAQARSARLLRSAPGARAYLVKWGRRSGCQRAPSFALNQSMGSVQSLIGRLEIVGSPPRLDHCAQSIAIPPAWTAAAAAPSECIAVDCCVGAWAGPSGAPISKARAARGPGVMSIYLVIDGAGRQFVARTRRSLDRRRSSSSRRSLEHTRTQTASSSGWPRRGARLVRLECAGVRAASRLIRGRRRRLIIIHIARFCLHS